MGFILKLEGQRSNIPFKIFECDTQSDMQKIDISSVPMGSRCYIINEGKAFALNSENIWKPIPVDKIYV